MNPKLSCENLSKSGKHRGIMNRIRVLFRKKGSTLMSDEFSERSISDSSHSSESVDWLEWQSPESLKEIVDQIEYLLNFIENILETGSVIDYPSVSQERLMAVYGELKCLHLESNHIKAGIKTLEFQMENVKKEIEKYIKIFPELQDEEKKEMESVLQRFDVFLHARWGAFKHSKNITKLENFLNDIRKRHTTLEKLLTSSSGIESRGTTQLSYTNKINSIPENSSITPCSKAKSITPNINTVSIKRTARPYKRRRPPESSMSTLRNISTPNDPKNSVTLYPISLLEKQYKLLANVHNFDTVLLPMEYIDLTQDSTDVPTNASIRTDPSSTIANRESTSSTSISSNIHSEMNCMVQSLFEDSTSTTSGNGETNITSALNVPNLFPSDGEAASDTDADINEMNSLS